jgi:hypothetical protein
MYNVLWIFFNCEYLKQKLKTILTISYKENVIWFNIKIEILMTKFTPVKIRKVLNDKGDKEIKVPVIRIFNNDNRNSSIRPAKSMVRYPSRRLKQHSKVKIKSLS